MFTPHSDIPRDFFGIAYGRTGDVFEGFALGSSEAQFDDTLLLIEPEAAKAYEEALRKPEPAAPTGPAVEGSEPRGTAPTTSASGSGSTQLSGQQPASKPPAARSFFGSAEIPAATAKMHLMQLADEIIANLVADPNAQVRVTLEISAEFESGAQESTKRAVSENATALKLKAAAWE